VCIRGLAPSAEHQNVQKCFDVLRGLYGRALKADRTLMKMIVILKVVSLESQCVGERKIVQHFMSTLGMMRIFCNIFDCTSCMRLAVSTL
jgi:hypothetical protein